MKTKLLILTGLILLTGCSKVELEEQIEEQTIDYVYVLNQLRETASWETLLSNEGQEGLVFPSKEREAHTDGYFIPTLRDGIYITWYGTENQIEPNGKAVVNQVTPNFSFHFNMETECVTVQGNEAVYGGRISLVTEISGNAPPIGEGWYFYFKVIDSGPVEGRNELIDQIANTTIFRTPMAPILCDGFPPDHYIWDKLGYSEVVEPGFVVVSNSTESKY
jgi:hypothetical protein